ncbi:MAG TPA: phosphatase PAP2 family protein [Burkholderiales bacterium]|nr:phosphatase PAP2 family protein [Burkholderiales bacterium]
MSTFYSALRRRLPVVEASVLAVIGLLGALLWLFISIAGEVREGETADWDRRLLLALRSAADPAVPWGPPWVQEMARDFTALGGVAMLSLMTFAAVGYLLLARKHYAAVAVFVAVAGGLVLSTLLKLGFDRPRPDLVPHGSLVYTTSFPSGHSMMAAVTYLTLGALLARVEGSIRIKIYLLSVAVVLTVLVGVSRVCLGVHWPTDVAAGWTVGAAWALLCSLVMRRLQRRGKVEPPSGEEL